jgi:FMN phosphatase YigB (HAD superfamily)
MDNTLFDNDALKRDLQETLVRLLGPELADRFWAIYELVRQEHDYVDIPATIARFQREHPEAQRITEVEEWLRRLPFDRYLYPGALETLAALRELGPVVIVSDGDAAFQPRKIARSGVAAAVDGRVLIYTHKQQQLPEVQQRYPADHYVLIDDKPSILADVKRLWGDRVTTVFVKQGHYAEEAAQSSYRPGPDLVASTIADVGRNARAWFGSQQSQASPATKQRSRR